MSADQPTVPYAPFHLKRRRRPPLGRLIWPWRIVTTELARRAPFVVLIRRPGQVLGIHFRLPDGGALASAPKHYGLSIRWGKPT